MGLRIVQFLYIFHKFASATSLDDAKLLDVIKECNLPVQMVQTSERPTRRVQVTRDNSGERRFAGFEGDLPSEAFADCDLDVSKLSGTWLYAADYLVTGTLSLASEPGRHAMMKLKKRTPVITEKPGSSSSHANEPPPPPPSIS